VKGDYMLLLNIAAGKFAPLPMPGDSPMLPQYVLNIDTSYFSDLTPGEVEKDMETWDDDPDRVSKVVKLNMDIFQFMERTSLVFDRVVIYRFLEHVPFTQVEYFIYLVSTIIRPECIVDVIVPDYQVLANILLDEDKYEINEGFDFQAHNILLTTELLNEPSCPHASIWTQERMKRFWELEGRFNVALQRSGYQFDGRYIYLRSLIKRL
jgi:hypothetical protein